MQLTVQSVYHWQPWKDRPEMMAWKLICTDANGQQRLIDISSRTTSPAYQPGQSFDATFSGATFAMTNDDGTKTVWEKASRTQNRGGGGQRQQGPPQQGYPPQQQQYAPQGQQAPPAAPPGYYPPPPVQPQPTQQQMPPPPTQGPPPGQFPPPMGQPVAQQAGAPGCCYPPLPPSPVSDLVDGRDRYPIDRASHMALLVELQIEYFKALAARCEQQLDNRVLTYADLFREAGTNARTTVIAMQLSIPREQ